MTKTTGTKNNGGLTINEILETKNLAEAFYKPKII